MRPIATSQVLETLLEARLPDGIQVDDAIQPISGPREVPCACLTGCAGTGKTYTLLQRTSHEPTYGILSSSTGISAVNLGAITINSLLGYFDTLSMQDAYMSGRLTRVLHSLAKQYRWLILDEMSMFSGDQLDLLYKVVQEANRYTDVKEPMGILLSGDFMQLPPIRERWAFEAECWPMFEANMETLTKVYRQGDGKFLDALNAVRRGHGELGAGILSSLGAEWHTALDTRWDGTTILPKNDQVSRYNGLCLDRLYGDKIKLQSRRWGKQQPEWGQNLRTKEWGIPPTLELKVGAYVMLLANEREGEDFYFVNGDCGHVMAVDFPEPKRGDPFVCVKLARSGREVYVHRITRMVEQEHQPEGFSGPTIPPSEDVRKYISQQHYRAKTKRYVTGQIEYFPIRLAWASTVHKTQSLTLDSIQVDFRNHFFSSPAMLYVALSRCRTFQGLRLVGQPEVFISRCKVDPRVVRWI